MQSFFGRFFGGTPDNDPGQGNSGKQEDKVRIAACAILMEVAGADDEFTTEEKAIIVDSLSREFSLSAGEVDELMSLARREINESIDTWGFTNTLNQNLSHEERIHILEIIWKVIYSDNNLSQHEDSLVHKLSYMLNLTHDQLIEAKLKIRPL